MKIRSIFKRASIVLLVLIVIAPKITMADAYNSVTLLCGSGLSSHRCTLADVTQACQDAIKNSNDGSKCNSSDVTVLGIVAGCAPSDSALSSTLSSIFGNAIKFTCSDEQKQQSAQAQQMYSAVTISCDGVFDKLSFTCILRGAIGALSASLLYIASWFLVLAGRIFDTTLYYTVVNYNIIYSLVQPAVEKGWQVFRDLANIGIIGIFTFIAISFILGIKEYGEKRLIANVLIVAVLINFSLLFTKIIINTSNAVSAAVYNSQISAGETNKNPQASSFNPYQGGVSDKGISGRFLASLKIKSFGDSFEANTAIGKSAGLWAQLLYGLFFFLLLTFAGLLFIYGSFLLIARAILLILLLITSAAAFATYMLPSLAKSEYGWSTWWSSLLRCAVLIPIMMILLSISMAMAEGIAKTSGGSLGDLIGHPYNAKDVITFINYLFILGILFATFKISSALSQTIAGFRFGVAPQLMAGGLAGSVGGRIFGLGAKLRQDRYKTKLDAANAAGDGKAAARYSRLMQRWDNLSKKQVNPLETGVGKNFAKSFGLSGVAGGQFGVKPYATSVHDRGAQIAKDVSKAKITPDQAKAQKDSIAEERQRNEITAQKEARKETLKQAREQTAVMKETARNTKANADRKTNDDKSRVEEELTAIKDELAAASQALTANPSDTGAAARVTAAQAKSAILMSERSSIIEKAKAQAQEFEQSISSADKILEKAQKEHDEAQATLDKANEAVTESKVQRVQSNFNAGVDRYIKRRALYQPHVAAAARHELGEMGKKENRKKWADIVSPDKAPPAAAEKGEAKADDHGGGH